MENTTQVPSFQSLMDMNEDEADRAINQLTMPDLLSIAEHIAADDDRVSQLSFGDLRYYVSREVRETRLFKHIVGD